MSLEGKLSDEQKARVLNEVERIRRKRLVERLYKEEMDDSDKEIRLGKWWPWEADLRQGMAASLSALAEINFELFVELVDAPFRGLDLWKKNVSTYFPPEVYAALGKKNWTQFLSMSKDIGKLGFQDANYFSLFQAASMLSGEYPDFFLEWYEHMAYFTPLAASRCLGKVAALDMEKYNSWHLQLISSKDDETRYYAARSVGSLFQIAPSVFSKEYITKVTDGDPSIRRGTVAGLQAVARASPEEFLKKYGEIFLREDSSCTLELICLLGEVARNDPESYMQFRMQYGKRQLSSEEQEALAFSIEGLADSKPDIFLELCQESIFSEDIYTQLGTAKTLFRVPAINKKTYLELYEAAIQRAPEKELLKKGTPFEEWSLFDGCISSNDRSGCPPAVHEDSWIRADHFDIRRWLRLWNNYPLKEENSQVSFLQMKEENGYTGSNIDNDCDGDDIERLEPWKDLFRLRAQIRFATVNSLHGLVKIDPKIFKTLIEREFYSLDLARKGAAAAVFGGLAAEDADLFFQLYQKGIKNYDICYWAACSLGSLAETVHAPQLSPIKDEEHAFLKAYFDSRYALEKTEEELLSEISPIVGHKDRNYKILHEITLRGEAGSTDELLECAAVNIPGYTAYRKLGEGSFKKVYLTEQQELPGQRYALLVTDVRHVQEKAQHHLRKLQRTALENCRGEAAKLARLNALRSLHIPFLAAPPQYDENRGIYYWVAEYVEKKLSDILSDRPMLYPNVEALLEQLVSGMVAANSLGLVHGDLSPSNIGISNDILKILDWGLCSTLPLEEGDYASREFPGYRLTRAPEIFGGGIPTEKSDVWSVGVIAYRLLTGAWPFYYQSFKGTSEEWRSLPLEQKAHYEAELKEAIFQHDPTILRKKADRLIGYSYGKSINNPSPRGMARFFINSCFQLDYSQRISLHDLRGRLSDYIHPPVFREPYTHS